MITSDGKLHAVDTILFATGFDLDKSLQAYQQIGLSGKMEELQARAYFGITHPEYPNFFVLLGKINKELKNVKKKMLEKIIYLPAKIGDFLTYCSCL